MPRSSPSFRSSRVRVGALLALVVGLAGCQGDLLATAVLTGPGTAEARFTTTGPVVLWSDWSGEWSGNNAAKLSLVYEIDVEQAGVLVGHVTCNTTRSSATSCVNERELPTSESADCEVKLRCELPPTKPGEIVLRVTGRLGDPDHTKRVSKMSLRVRKTWAWR